MASVGIYAVGARRLPPQPEIGIRMACATAAAIARWSSPADSPQLLVGLVLGWWCFCLHPSDRQHRLSGRSHRDDPQYLPASLFLDRDRRCRLLAAAEGSAIAPTEALRTDRLTQDLPERSETKGGSVTAFRCLSKNRDTLYTVA